MPKIRPRARWRNLNLPCLFVWAEARDRRRFPRHVRALAARHGLTLATAATVCHLAGIGLGGER